MKEQYLESIREEISKSSIEDIGEIGNRLPPIKE